MLGLLVGISLALSLLPVVWAGPDQNEARQTVPTATSAPRDDDDDDDDDAVSTPTVVAVPEAQPTLASAAVEASPVLLPVSGGYTSGWGWAVLGSLGALLLVGVGIAEKRPR
jgi:hypothetical protein